MIQRPQKRIGGAIGLELDAIWQAMARLEVTGDDNLLVDRTSHGTQIRKREETDNAMAALFCVSVAPLAVGWPFKARRVVSGYQFTIPHFNAGPLEVDPIEEDVHFAAFVSPMSGLGTIGNVNSPYNFGGIGTGHTHAFCRRYNHSRAVGEIFIAIKILISTVPPENHTNADPVLGPNIELTAATPTWIDAGFFTDFNSPSGVLSNEGGPIDPNTGCPITPGGP